MSAQLICDNPECNNVITDPAWPQIVKEGTATTDFCSWACVVSWASQFVEPEEPCE